jgi:hypothetical protein
VRLHHANPRRGIRVPRANRRDRPVPAQGNWLSQWYKGLTTPFPTDKAAVVRVANGQITRGINASLRRGGQISGNGKTTQATADPVKLTAGHVTTGVDATMRPGATIAGTVTDAAGRRLSDVCVGIDSRSEQFLSLDGEFTDIEFTTNGSYRASNLTPGAYAVNFGCGVGPVASQWFRSLRTATAADLVSAGAGRVPRVSARSCIPPGQSPALSRTARERRSAAFARSSCRPGDPIRPLPISACQGRLGETAGTASATWQPAAMTSSLPAAMAAAGTPASGTAANAH